MEKVYIVKGYRLDTEPEARPFIFGVYSAFKRAQEVAAAQSSDDFYFYVDIHVVN